MKKNKKYNRQKKGGRGWREKGTRLGIENEWQDQDGTQTTTTTSLYKSNWLDDRVPDKREEKRGRGFNASSTSCSCVPLHPLRLLLLIDSSSFYIIKVLILSLLLTQYIIPSTAPSPSTDTRPLPLKNWTKEEEMQSKERPTKRRGNRPKTRKGRWWFVWGRGR